MTILKHHKLRSLGSNNQRSHGFTIVELLVVIVIVGILATLAIVAYNGVSRQAVISTLGSDLSNTSKQLKVDQVLNSAYPATTGGANNGLGLKASNGTTYQYTVDNNANPQTFCVTATNGSIAYYITNDGVPIVGVCPGHTSPSVGVTDVWKKISIGNEHSCAIGSNNLAYCWGGNANGGEIGDNSSTDRLVPVPVYTAGVLSGKTMIEIASGFYHTCAIASDNLAYCWGNNGFGRLGNNSASNSLAPVAVSTSGALSGKTVTAISAGQAHTCAIASDNLAYCWGLNGSGQLGNNSTATSLVPVAVSTSGVLSGRTILQISSTYDHSCVVASDNLAYCWGLNGSGQLGNNSTATSLVPVAVSTSGVLSGKTIRSITTSQAHTCVVASDNLAYCWGSNGSGQLGNNSTATSLVPVAVSTSGVLSGKTIDSISAGYAFTCVVASDDQAYCWGRNDYGQLGNNSYSTSLIPVAVSTSGLLSGKTIDSLSAHGVHTCAIASGSPAYCWGLGDYGRLGNNTETTTTVPVQVVTPSF